MSQAAGYSVVEWTPYRFSLGTGVGYEMLAPPAQSNGPGPISDDGPHWYGISVPVIVGFNLFESSNPSAFDGPRFASAWKGRGASISPPMRSAGTEG